MKRIFLADVPEEGVSHDPGILKRVLLRRGDVPHLTGLARAVLRAGQRTTPHRHADMYEIFLVQAGSGTLTVEGKEVLLEPGVCVLVEPGEEHDIVNDGPSVLVLHYFGVEG